MEEGISFVLHKNKGIANGSYYPFMISYVLIFALTILSISFFKFFLFFFHLLFYFSIIAHILSGMAFRNKKIPSFFRMIFISLFKKVRTDSSLERVEGIEPSRQGRKHCILPLNYTRINYSYYN